MSRKYKFIILIVGLSLATIAFIFWQVSNDMMFVNETFALLLLVGSAVVKWSRADKVQGVIFFFLFIPLFSLLSYSYTVEKGDTTTTYHSVRFDALINPIVFFVFIIYLAINLSVVIKLLRYVFNGSHEEIQKKNKKMTLFYYDKFSSADEPELIGFYKRYNDYPKEAQTALRKIHEERNLNVLNFN